MALISCPECGRDVSDTCRCCIHCGYSLSSAAATAVSAETSANEAEGGNQNNILTLVKKNRIPVLIAASIVAMFVVISFVISLSATEDPFAELYINQPRESVHAVLGEPDTRGRSLDSDVYTADIYKDFDFLGRTCDLIANYEDDTANYLSSAALTYTIQTDATDHWKYFYDILEFYTKKYGNPECLRSENDRAEYVWYLESGEEIKLSIDVSRTIYTTKIIFL